MAMFQAMADGDGETACKYMTSAARERAVGDTPSCAEGVEAMMSKLDEPSRERMERMTVKSVEQRGPSRARVYVGVGDASPGIAVIKDGDTWLVHKPPYQ